MKHAVLFFIFSLFLFRSSAAELVLNVRDFGAAPGTGPNTKAIQSAIDSAENAGGGIVLEYISAGQFS